jgi:hypothetical protein
MVDVEDTTENKDENDHQLHPENQQPEEQTAGITPEAQQIAQADSTQGAEPDKKLTNKEYLAKKYKECEVDKSHTSEDWDKLRSQINSGLFLGLCHNQLDVYSSYSYDYEQREILKFAQYLGASDELIKDMSNPSIKVPEMRLKLIDGLTDQQLVSSVQEPVAIIGAALESYRQELELFKEHIASQNAGYKEEIATLRENRARLQEETEALKEYKTRLLGETELLKAENTRLNKDIEVFKEENSGLTDKINDMEQEIDSLKKRILSMQNLTEEEKKKLAAEQKEREKEKELNSRVQAMAKQQFEEKMDEFRQEQLKEKQIEQRIRAEYESMYGQTARTQTIRQPAGIYAPEPEATRKTKGLFKRKKHNEPVIYAVNPLPANFNISQYLMQKKLNTAQLQIITYAVKANIDESIIKQMIDNNLPAEQMKQVIEIILVKEQTAQKQMQELQQREQIKQEQINQEDM